MAVTPPLTRHAGEQVSQHRGCSRHAGRHTRKESQMHSASITRTRGASTAEGAADHRWWTLAAVCTGVFMLLLDITIVNVALPDIGRSFHASFADLQWVISAYALTLAAFLLTAGSLADLYGRRRLFASGIVIFTTGSLCCGLATGSLFLELARAGQGVGGAIMFATSLALLAQSFQGRDRGVALGLFGAITGIAVAVGPVLGGALTSGLSWRWIFYVNVPIGIAAFLVTVLRVDESRNPDATRPDWAGFVTFSLALASLVYGLIESQGDGWGSRTVIGRSWRAPSSDRLPRRRTGAGRADARSGSPARADVRRRPRRGLGDLGVDLLPRHLPRHLPAGGSWLLRRRRGRALPAADRRDLRRCGNRRPPHLARAAPGADRAGIRPDRRRAAADARPHCELGLDAPARRA